MFRVCNPVSWWTRSRWGCYLITLSDLFILNQLYFIIIIIWLAICKCVLNGSERGTTFWDKREGEKEGCSLCDNGDAACIFCFVSCHVAGIMEWFSSQDTVVVNYTSRPHTRVWVYEREKERENHMYPYFSSIIMCNVSSLVNVHWRLCDKT